MAVRIESMAEPLPGYRLIERLGGGGFGEVWKAEAPGGLFKAIKFVYGDLESADDEGARAGQEFKALQRVITVRHPFILSVERFDIIEGRLMIVTELADRTLWDRFRECRGQGMPGIPRDELLRYMRDTAEALDLMNTEYQLQHLDIKPQNLFLVHTHVKVADFGLVKDLEGMLASVTGGVTPVYAAPETFEGKVSRFSDQYSLSIVYQELLTGHRPYTGTTLRQLVMQHCQGAPDLRPLPECDRPVVLRALAKKHQDRFPSCQDFVEALHVAGKTAPAPKKPRQAEPGTGEEERSAGQAPGTGADEEKTQGAQKAFPAQNDSGLAAEPVTRVPGAGAVPGRPDSTAPLGSKPTSETPSGAVPSHATPSSSHPALEPRADGVLLPGVVIGLGKFGLGTLRQLRKEVSDHFGSPDVMPSLRLVYIDTDPDALQMATRGRATLALRASEVLHTRLHRPSHYIKPRDTQTELERWLHPKMLYRIPRQQTSAGIRALGRLAFVDNYRAISRRIQVELEECCALTVLNKTVRKTGLNMYALLPRVYVITSLGGGTGSGMFIDIAYLVRQQLQELGYETAEVVGLCYLPHVNRDARRVPELANTFASLTELNHYSSPHSVFSANYELGEVRSTNRVFRWKGPPFHRCLFFGLSEGRGSAMPDEGQGPTFPPALAPTISSAAHVIFTDMATPLGRTAERRTFPDEPPLEQSARTRMQQVDGVAPTLFQMPGLYRLVWPRRQLLEEAAVNVSRRLVQRWMTKDARPLREVVTQWLGDQWEEHGFGADRLIGRFQQGCEKVFGQSPESIFQAIHNNVTASLKPVTAKTPPNAPEAALNITVLVQAMGQLEELVGIPEECRPPTRVGEPSGYQAGSLETSLKDVAVQVTDQYEQKLSEIVVWLIEQPNYRLAGAEEALRQLRAAIEQSLQTHEQLAHELQQRAAQVYHRIHKLLDNPSAATPSSSIWRQTFSRRPAAGPSPIIVELLELVRAFPKLRYQSMIMQYVTTLYVSLRGLLSDQMREVDYCRARLGELLSLLSTPGAPASSDSGQSTPGAGPDGTGGDQPLAGGRYLFTEGCKSLEEAVARLEGTVGVAELVELDGRMQALLRRQFKALVHVCMSSANMLKTLFPAMLKEARAYLRARLGEIHVADIYLRQFGTVNPETKWTKEAENDLTAAIEQAAPEVAAASAERELNILAVPPGEAEELFRELAAKAAHRTRWTPATCTDEIVIYREHTLRCLADLKQMGPMGQDAYQKLIAQDHFTPHSRCDVLEWGPR
jgi:serine/threonine protein kinase